MAKIKTIIVQAKEWFDKVNGNSYFSAEVTLNFGLKDQRVHYLPFQYGYGDHYRDAAYKHLQEVGEIPKQEGMKSYWSYYEDNGIVYRHSKEENCKKRELTQ